MNIKEKINVIKEGADNFFSLASFFRTSVFLFLSLFLFIALNLFFPANVSKPPITGKIMASFEVPSTEHAPELKPQQEVKQEIKNENITPPPVEQTEQLEIPEPNPEPNPESSAPTEIEDSIAGLSEESDFGPLPVIRSSDKRTPFEAYKTPFHVKEKTQGVISLVMIDFGLSGSFAKSAVKILPKATTFVANPYADILQAKISYARKNGHEIWMGIPFAGTDNQSNILDAGQNALYAGLKPKENMDRLNTNLGRATGYAGVAVAVDTDFADQSPDLQILINTIATRGLGIAQLDTTDTAITTAAKQTPTKLIQNTVWIDKNLTKDSTLTTLSTIEKIALEKGYVVASFHPSPVLFKILSDWQKTLDTKNIQLAPLSYSAMQNSMTINQQAHE